MGVLHGELGEQDELQGCAIYGGSGSGITPALLGASTIQLLSKQPPQVGTHAEAQKATPPAAVAGLLVGVRRLRLRLLLLRLREAQGGEQPGQPPRLQPPPSIHFALAREAEMGDSLTHRPPNTAMRCSRAAAPLQSAMSAASSADGGALGGGLLLLLLLLLLLPCSGVAVRPSSSLRPCLKSDSLKPGFSGKGWRSFSACCASACCACAACA